MAVGGDSADKSSPGLSPKTWRKVISAIEESIPLYDQVNNLISFGKAQAARKFAIQRLQLTDEVSILDSGIGPGTTSKLIVRTVKPHLLVGLDGSVTQLRTAKANLDTLEPNRLQLVRGSFEFLPFRDKTFDAIITCYALRDSLDLSRSIGEYYRVCAQNGLFADVDIGKPENLLKRAGSSLYIRYLMPIIAKATILGKIRGNPWRMIGPTYKSLPTNHALLLQIKSKFQSVDLKEFLMGGAIVIIGRKSSS
jgi:demethylmenaquinone methyltransferase / 2-methoxy-6-polyprenyl-1,4-benzoquinol methylase